MRILVVPEWYPSAASPINGVFVQDQARSISHLHEVAVIYHEPAPALGRTPESAVHLESGIPVARVRTPGWWLPSIRRAGFAAILDRTLRGLSARSRAPHVLHAHEFSAGVMSYLAGHRRYAVVISEHHTDFIEERVRGWDAYVARSIFRRADLVCPVSGLLAESLRSLEPRAHYEVVPNVVELEPFEAIARNRTEKQSRNRLLTVARLDRQKGIEYLLRALALGGSAVPGVHLDIVGDGPARPMLEGLARELGLDGRVFFHGDRARGDVAGFMARAHVFVLPSLVETFGVVLVEAIAAGLPIVTTTAVPDHARLVKFGAVVAPADASALAKGIQAVSGNRLRPRQQEIDSFVEPFRSTEVARRWTDLYGRVGSRDHRPLT